MPKPVWMILIAALPAAVLAQNTGNPAGLSPAAPGVEMAQPAADHADTSGATLDAKYLASQIMDHQKTVNLLLWHLSYGQNEQLRDYSTETLPVIMQHLQMARDLQARLVPVDQHPRG